MGRFGWGVRLGWKTDVEKLQKAVKDVYEKADSGFTELREQNAESRGLLKQVHADLARLRQEVEGLRDSSAAMRTEIYALRHHPASPAATAGATGAVGAVGADTDDEEGLARVRLLGLAAAVARAEVVCHRDTWAFIVERASRGEHFRLPTDISEQPDGTVEVDVSGRSLLAAVDELWQVQREPTVSEGTRRMAAQVYRRIGEALEGAEQVPESAGAEERRAVRIVIDDRPGPAVERPPAG